MPTPRHAAERYARLDRAEAASLGPSTMSVILAVGGGLILLVLVGLAAFVALRTSSFSLSLFGSSADLAIENPTLLQQLRSLPTGTPMSEVRELIPSPYRQYTPDAEPHPLFPTVAAKDLAEWDPVRDRNQNDKTRELDRAAIETVLMMHLHNQMMKPSRSGYGRSGGPQITYGSLAFDEDDGYLGMFTFRTGAR